MVALDLSLPLPATDSLPGPAGVELARRAEDAGYGTVLVAETWGREAFGRLGYLAAATDRVRLGTGIVPVHSRSPTLLAQAIATLDELSGGRAVLGLGLSSPAVVENWHGVAFEPALRRQRETIEVVRAALSGETVEYDGELFDLEHFHLRFDPPRTDVPILVAAQGETNVELAGGFADGWMPNRIPVSALPAVREHVDRGARMQGRDPAEVRTVPYVTTCVLEDGARARRRCREMIAFYLGAMGEYHFRAVADHGYRTEAERVRERWQDGDREGARSAVGGALLDEIALAGTPEDAAAVLGEYEDVADGVVTLLPRTLSRAEIEETVDHVGTLAVD
ncbi:MAG: LLM class flavin-dependent oxidoreductase [Haloarculaceae archaeon]